MANYILTSIDAHHIDFERKRVDAYTIASIRLDNMKWPIYCRTSNKKIINPGDHCLIYIGGRKTLTGNIIALATVGNVVNDNTPVDSLDVLTGNPERVLPFSDINRFEMPVNIKAVLNYLEFTPKNTKHWGVSLQGGCKKISDYDFNWIVNSRYNSIV